MHYLAFYRLVREERKIRESTEERSKGERQRKVEEEEGVENARLRSEAMHKLHITQINGVVLSPLSVNSFPYDGMTFYQIKNKHNKEEKNNILWLFLLH